MRITLQRAKGVMLTGTALVKEIRAYILLTRIRLITGEEVDHCWIKCDPRLKYLEAGTHIQFEALRYTYLKKSQGRYEHDFGIRIQSWIYI